MKSERVFPRISYVPKIVSENGQQALAVIIPGSDLRPHFAGLSYVRRGSETLEASEEQFAKLLAQRQSKVRKLLEWESKEVTVFWRAGRNESRVDMFYRLRVEQATLVSVSADWATFRVHFENENDADFTEPISKLVLSWDDGLAQLRVEVSD